MGYHIFQTNLNVFVCDGVDMKFDVVVVVMFLNGVDILLIWQTSLIYILTYLHTYIHAHTHMHTHTHTHIHTYTHTHMHTYTHTHIHVCIHTCMYACVRVFVVVCCFTGIYLVWTCANVWSLRTNRHVRWFFIILYSLYTYIYTYDIRLIMNSMFNLW